MIEILTFRLRSGVDEADFLALDKHGQAAFRYQQPGLVRSTTARGADDRWLVLQIWTDEAAADAAREAFRASPIGKQFVAMLDESTVTIERFTALD